MQVLSLFLCSKVNMTTHANIKGANITRLRFNQMHSNQCQCVLMQPPIEDNEGAKYIAAVEKLVVSTDIPIFKKNTLAFYVSPVLDQLQTFDDGDFYEEPTHTNRYCYVGPVYSFSDFLWV